MPWTETPSAPIAAVVHDPAKIDVDEVRTEVARAERATGHGPTPWFETREDDVGQGAARAALDAGADLVIAAGGTARAAAEVVAGSNAVFAILPAGTGNLLARNLQLPLDAVGPAVDIAFSGRDRAIDVGAVDVRRADSSVDAHAFVVMAGAGLDAKTIEATDDDLKKEAGILAYVHAVGRVLLDRSRLPCSTGSTEAPRRA